MEPDRAKTSPSLPISGACGEGPPNTKPDEHVPKSSSLNRRVYRDLSQSSIGDNVSINSSQIEVAQSGEVEDLGGYDFTPKLKPTSLNSPSSDSIHSDPFSTLQDEEQGVKTRRHEPDIELMEEHDSYHEEITGEEAEKRLKACCQHGYLTRFSQKKRSYMLSVYKLSPTGDDIFKHFVIRFKNRQNYRVKEESFDTLQDMLAHYQQNRIHPGLKKIGRIVTEDEYIQRTRTHQAVPIEDPPAENRRKKCIIL